jgi:hypothetical protein
MDTTDESNIGRPRSADLANADRALSAPNRDESSIEEVLEAQQRLAEALSRIDNDTTINHQLLFIALLFLIAVIATAVLFFSPALSYLAPFGGFLAGIISTQLASPIRQILQVETRRRAIHASLQAVVDLANAEATFQGKDTREAQVVSIRTMMKKLDDNIRFKPIIKTFLR